MTTTSTKLRSKCRRITNRNRGFSLLEVMVTLATTVIAGSLGMPALTNFLHRSRIEGTARQALTLMHASRLESITRGIPTVFGIDPTTMELVAFADVDGAGSDDPPDGIFNPVTGDPYRQTDYELGRYRIPNGVVFMDPDGNLDVDSVDGFDNPLLIPDDFAAFAIDGSVADAGAFRFADLRGNFLETRIVAATTARTEVRKWNEEESAWLSQGQEGAWAWQ